MYGLPMTADPGLAAVLLVELEALPRPTRHDLHEAADGVRFVKRVVRFVNIVPPAWLFLWPVLIFWLVPGALRSARIRQAPGVQALVDRSKGLPRRNWAEDGDHAHDPIDDIVALRDSVRLYPAAIFIPFVLYVGVIVATVLAVH